MVKPDVVVEAQSEPFVAFAGETRAVRGSPDGGKRGDAVGNGVGIGAVVVVIASTTAAVVIHARQREDAAVVGIEELFEVIPFRGNVGTRLEKMKSGEVAAILLAVAGLNRLGLQAEITSYLDFDEMLPAPGQGAVALETRVGDETTGGLLSPLNHTDTGLCARVERAVSLGLGASCRMPLGALATINGDQITAKAALFSPDGKNVWQKELAGPTSNPEGLGTALAEAIKAMADPKILEAYKIF